MVEALAIRAKMGLITGLICIAAVADGPDQLSMSGDFAEDIEYAARAATSGFAALIELPAQLPAQMRLRLEGLPL
jgi:hypothetical protein